MGIRSSLSGLSRLVTGRCLNVSLRDHVLSAAESEELRKICKQWPVSKMSNKLILAFFSFMAKVISQKLSLIRGHGFHFLMLFL